jgi:hypothetical protein
MELLVPRKMELLVPQKMDLLVPQKMFLPLKMELMMEPTGLMVKAWNNTMA